LLPGKKGVQVDRIHVERSDGGEAVTPDQYARQYLERHGMISGYDFVPATAIDKAAKLYTEFVDEDQRGRHAMSDMLLSGWPGGEPIDEEL
jgi:hypothetical protein